MGQRHQIFVKIANPVHYLPNLSRFEKKNLEREFGDKPFTVLAYHNQWLYGRSALQNCMNLLAFGKQFTKADKTDAKAIGGIYDCPFAPKSMDTTFNQADKIIQAIVFIMNYRATKTPWLGAGFGSSFYIGKEEEMSNFNYKGGDNNDGITIVDLVENKYCFMNINGKSDTIANSASDLPNFEPVDAKAYVTAYYGETPETIASYLVERAKSERKAINKNIKVNKLALKGFEKFKVLTAKEVDKIFYTITPRKKKEKKEKV